MIWMLDFVKLWVPTRHFTPFSSCLFSLILVLVLKRLSLSDSSFVFIFYFDSLLSFISSHKKLLHGLKGSSIKDPSASLLVSRECIQRDVLFCFAHYYIYPTADSLYCRSQGLFADFFLYFTKLYRVVVILWLVGQQLPYSSYAFPQAIYVLCAVSVRQMFTPAVVLMLYIIICHGVHKLMSCRFLYVLLRGIKGSRRIPTADLRLTRLICQRYLGGFRAAAGDTGIEL